MTVFKTLQLFAVVTAMFSTGVNAQVFVSQDFNSVPNPGLPTGWTSAPSSLWQTGEPNTVTPQALNGLQYSLNNDAHTKAVGIDGNQASADGARLTSPTFSLPSSATNAMLKFDVAFFNIQSNNTPPETESLIFIISTNGGSTWSDISFVGPVNSPSISLWDTRSIAMGAYAGQSNLKFGFRYNNEGGNLIGAVLDNIKVVDGADGIVVSAFAGDRPDPSTGIGYQLTGSNATLTGTVENTGSTAINSYYIKYKVGTGATQSSSLITTPLAPLASAAFPAGLSVTIPTIAEYSIKAWIEAASDVDHQNDTATATAVGVPSYPTKRPVFEERTGTWCGWCPRGAVFMDKFADEHPNGAASQIAVHNNDPMRDSVYDSYMDNYATAFPTIIVDRFSIENPIDIDAAFAKAQNNFGFADISFGTHVVTGNTVTIPVVIKPAVNITNPRLALVVTESNVQGSGGNWPQNNYYSGGGSGTMGGWESEASHVTDVYFHFVARTITPSADGSIDSLPSTLMAGITYTTTLTAPLISAWKTNNLQYIALLINGNNSSIMNSISTSLPALTPALGNTNAAGDIDNKIELATLYPNPTSGKSYLSIKMKEGGEAVVTVCDITGRQLFSTTQQVHSGDNTISIETDKLAAGSYLVHFATEKVQAVLKLQVIK